jgi:predicted transcriptional regulator
MEFIAKATKQIKATLIINTHVRVALELTMEEYAVANSIYETKKAGKPVLISAIHFETGLVEDAIREIIEVLKEKGIIDIKQEGEKRRAHLTDKWNKLFNIDQEFDNEDELNPGFWQIFLKRGNKQQSKVAYTKARKIVDADTLRSAATRYIASKDGEEFKHIMHASTWLNPDVRHWEDEVQTGKLETDAKETFKGSFFKK